jgi:hypothetical protein
MSWKIRCRIVVVAILVVFSVSVHAAVTNPATAGALGYVFVSTGNKVLVFGHDGTSKPDDTITFDTGVTVTASAFDPGLNFFVATQMGTIFKVIKIDRSTHLPSDIVNTGLNSVVTSIVFDQDGNFYLGSPGSGGSPATARKYECTNFDSHTNECATFTEAATFSLTCDANIGLWMDLAPRQPDVATQHMYYDCGKTDIRKFNVLDTNPSTELVFSLASPGDARDLRLMPPIRGQDADAAAIAVAAGRNVKLLNLLGQVLATFDTGSVDGWSSVEFAPGARQLWAAQGAATPVVYRFELPDGDSIDPLFNLPDPNNPFTVTTGAQIPSSFTAPITSLAANGGYHSAVLTRRLLLNSSTSTAIAKYLDHTAWVNSWQLEATVTEEVRIAVTLYEGGRFADVHEDFNLNRRLAAFSTANLNTNPNPLYAYRGRAAFVRAVQTSTVNISGVDTLVTMDYILPTFPNGSARSVMLDDPGPESDVGFTDADQFAKDLNGQGGDITREWFQTQETLRGGTKGLNDFLVASLAAPLQTTIVAPTGLKTFKIGNPVTIRAKTNDKSSVNHCRDMILTIARAESADLPAVIVGSSLTNLITSQGLPSVFSSVSGNVCQTNFVMSLDISELPDEDDFQPFRKYNFCVNFRPEPGGPVLQAFGDACGSFMSAP